VYALWQYDPVVTPPPTYVPDNSYSEPQAAAPQPTPPQKQLPPTATPQPGYTVPVNENTDRMRYTVNSSNGNPVLAASTAELAEIIGATGDTLEVNLTGLTGATGVTVPSTILPAVGKANINMEINLPNASLTFSAEAVNNLVKLAGGSGIEIIANLVDSAPDTAQPVAAESRSVYELSVYDGTKFITNFNAPVGVRLPYTLSTGENSNAVVVYYLDGEGGPQMVKDSEYQEGYATFTTNHFSHYMVAYNPVNFTDINGHWADSAIVFAGARELVTGYGDGRFNPDGHVTRAEFVQMVYNVLEMEPVDIGGNDTYSDVNGSHWYYNAITAARSSNLLNGLVLMGNAFGPNEPITRQEMAQILANIAVQYNLKVIGQTSAQSFSDYAEINYSYANAVETAINTGLLNASGMGNGSFSPNRNTTRAQSAVIQIKILQSLSDFK
jgi:endo-1,4-beta-xylanase